MLEAIGQTFSFAGGLVVPILLYGMVVSLVSSPVIVVGWALGYGREVFSDPSDQARFVRTFHIATTAIVVAAALWLLS